MLENTEPVIILDFNRKLQEFSSLSLPVSYLAPRWSTVGPSAPPSRANAASPRRVGSAAGPSAPSSRAAMGAPPAGRPVRPTLAGSAAGRPARAHLPRLPRWERGRLARPRPPLPCVLCWESRPPACPRLPSLAQGAPAKTHGALQLV